MTLARRERHVLQHIVAGVDVLISSLYLQARGLIKKEIGRHGGKPADKTELRINRDTDLKLFNAWASQTLGIKDGRDAGTPNKPKTPEELEIARKEHEREMVEAMCQILKRIKDDQKITKKRVSTQMKRSPSTLYEWFDKGLDFDRAKSIALIIYTNRLAFAAWQRTGKGFDELYSTALSEYEKNLS